MMSKKRNKQLIYGLELRNVGIIVNGLAKKEPKNVVFKKIRDSIKKNKTLNLSEKRFIVARLSKRYVKVYRKVRTANTNEIYKVIRKDVLPVLEHEKNLLANHIEVRDKEQYLDKLLEEGVFYLCSSHTKPAADHKDYEGKIYVSEDWETRIDDESTVKKVRAYIRNHKTQTVEYIIGAPVYMVTRPNCKHYFKRISIEDVLGHSEKRLLKDNNMFMEDKLPESYEKRQYRGYYERLKALMYLKEMFQCEELDNDIKNTRRLMYRWASVRK